MRKSALLCDIGLLLILGLIGSILLTGVDSVTVLGHRITSHRLENPVTLLGILVFFRILITDWEGTFVRFFPQFYGWAGVSILWGVFLLVQCSFSLFQHRAGATTMFDLGIFDQILYNNLHGRFFQSSVEGTHFLGVHFSPILAPLTLLYWIVPRPEALLLFQVVAVSSAVIPVYRIALYHFHDPRKALFFAYAFLLYPGIGYVLQFDFHPEVLAVPFFFWAYWFYLQKSPLPFVLFLGLALSCKEEVGFIVGVWGLCMVLFDRNTRWGGGLILTGLVYIVLVLFVAIPHFSGAEQTRFVNRYEHLGKDIPSIAGFLLSHPLEAVRLSFTGQKLQNLLGQFLPLGFTSFFGISLFPVCLPTALLAFFSSVEYQSSIKTHYGSTTFPFLLISGMLGVRFLLGRFSPPGTAGVSPTRKRGISFEKGLFALLIALLFITGMRPYLIPLRDHPFTPRIPLDQLKTLKGLVSETDTLTVTNVPGPQFSRREGLLPYPLTRIQGREVDKVLIYFGDRMVRENRQEADRIVEELTRDRGYVPLYQTESVLLLEKTGEKPMLPPR